jgi:2-methylcitrate dehydratase
MWKGASFANAARNGVFAAELAREGVTGPAPIFEGEMGFFRQVSGRFALDVGAFGRRRRGFKLDETYLKFWPAEYHAQTAVAAALALRKRVRRPAGVKSVLVETHEAGYTILAKDQEKWRPETKETADHSLPYMVGMALLHGRVDNATYSERNLRSAANRRFVSKVTVVEDRKLTELYPSRGMANRITVTLEGGERLVEEALLPRGHPLNPMTDREVEEKFLALTERTLGTKAAAALEALWGVEDCKDIRRLMKALSP